MIKSTGLNPLTNEINMVHQNTKLIILNPLEDPSLKNTIDSIILANRNKKGNLMVILNEVQNSIGFVSEDIQRYISGQLKIPLSKVHGVISFYSFFTTKPRGLHTIKFCMGTACYVGGAPQLIEKGKQLLGIGPGETTENFEITVEGTRCVGACSQAPVVVIDDVIHGRVNPSTFTKLLRAIEKRE